MATKKIKDKEEIKNKDKPKERNKGGRPSSFKTEYIDLAYNYTLLGASDKDLANFFDVAEQTINYWKNQFPEFSESLKKGKYEADSEIALSLYRRAKGCKVKEQQLVKLKRVTYQDKKRIEDERVEIVEIEKELPPDTTSCIFWLKNRKPENWRDKVNTDLTTNGKDIKSEPLIIQVIDNSSQIESLDDGKDTDS